MRGRGYYRDFSIFHFAMRYYYEPKNLYFGWYGTRYECDHPVYSCCTLYLEGTKGLAVIQQRYDPVSKRTWWGEIDDCLRDDLYLNLRFKEYFSKMAAEPTNGLYPTVTVRQMMWAFKMKPLKRQAWETVFDRAPI